MLHTVLMHYISLVSAHPYSPVPSKPLAYLMLHVEKHTRSPLPKAFALTVPTD